MTWFRTVFLVVLFAGLAARLWLAARQAAHVAAHRAAVPIAFRERISLEAHQKAADYTLARDRPGMVSSVVDVVVVLAWTLGGGINWLNNSWPDAISATLAANLAVILSVAILDSIPGLPFSVWSTFVVERRFGFNRTTPGLFVIDMIKGVVLLLVIGAPLVAGVLWLMGSAGRLWWLYAWIGWLAFSLILSWAYPAFIAPRFNRFSPLRDETLRAQIESLLTRCGFRASAIFVMDGSRRSTHGNAYFTGLGKTRRVVFFDTLLADLAPGELLAILAHELGHYRLRHIQKQIVLSGAFGLAVLGMLAWLIGQAWFYHGLGVDHPSDGAALALLMVAGPAFSFFLTPVFALISRRFEQQADDYAARQTAAGDLVRALVKLYDQNATTLTPDPVYSAVYDSHPPASIRVSRLQQADAGAQT